MISKSRVLKSLTLVGLAVLIVLNTPRPAHSNDDDNDNSKKSAPTPTPIGAWFGIARPCPPPVAPGPNGSVPDSSLHASFCNQICGMETPACGNAGILPAEVPMMPTLLADGTVLADDAGEILRYHTTAHGKWMVSPATDHSLPADPTGHSGTTRYQATFFWLGSLHANFPGPDASATAAFDNAVRPRFVTYFDPQHPDRMIGFIQPYLFGAPPNNQGKPQFVTGFPGSQGGVSPGTPAIAPQIIVNPIAAAMDPFTGNHIPELDPLSGSTSAVTGPLPDGCDLSKGCLGTYHFVIRRVPAQ